MVAGDERVRSPSPAHPYGRPARRLATGAGPFMLAEFYRREAGITSTVVLASTVVSLATISAYLAMSR